jgi:hypothetical protein
MLKDGLSKHNKKQVKALAIGKVATKRVNAAAEALKKANEENPAEETTEDVEGRKSRRKPSCRTSR